LEKIGWKISLKQQFLIEELIAQKPKKGLGKKKL